ncbi:MAG: carboxypeptidase regulatory-like domain-containing protein, partial [Bryobacteraceae bacterium]
MLPMRILSVLLALSWALNAQQDQGSITGTITDNTGAVVPDALVTARDVNTNIAVSHRTNQDGVYFIGPLKIGVYEVTVESKGFKKAVRGGVDLHANDRLGIDFTLQVGDVVEVVEVTGQAPILETETSSLDYVVSRRQITEFPLNSRNYQTLALLTAGVAPEIGGRDRAGGFVSHGQSALQNNFIIDGIDNNSTVMGMQDRKAQAIIPSLDAVQEFKVQTSNYTAEFGRNAGAVVNVTIRSGTNDFHGTAYEFLRNDVFDARPTFGYTDRDGDGRADPEVLRQNQFGGTFGGPILHNRTFFFGSWEAWRIRHAQSDLSIVPSALERTGDFSQTPRLANLRDPEGGVFPGKRIPANRIDPVAAKLVALYPEANFSGSTRQNYVSNPPWSEDRDQFDFRVDHRFSDRDNIFGRYSFYRYDNLRGAPLPGLARGGVGNDRALDDNDGRHLVISETHVFTPNLVNEARYGLKWLKVDKRALTQLTRNEVASEFGIQGLPDRESLQGLPLIALGGALNFTGLGEAGFLPNFKISRTNQ